MTHIGYKALGSYPRAHETLIPFKQLANIFFFAATQRGERAIAIRFGKPPGGIRGEGSVVGKIAAVRKVIHLITRICFSAGSMIYSMQYVANDTETDLHNPRIGAVHKRARAEAGQA